MISSRYLVLLAVIGSVVAQESTLLYVPGFDEQALSADVLGVGSDGRTTWALQAPTVTPAGTTFDDPNPGTATLIEGSDYASVGQVFESVTLAIACTISADVAVCSDGLHTDIETDSVSKFAVQLGSTAAPAPTQGASITSGGSTSGGSSGTRSLTTIESSQSSGSSPPATSTSTTSGASGRWEVPLYMMFATSLLTGIVWAYCFFLLTSVQTSSKSAVALGIGY